MTIARTRTSRTEALFVALALVTASLLAGCPDIPVTHLPDAFDDSDVVDSDADVDPDAIIPLILDRVRANVDDINGGERVTISGSGFEPGMRVTFGGIPGSGALTLDETELNVDVPPHPPGLVDILVERLDGETAILEQSFLYRAPMELHGIEPARSRLAGGQHVTVTGVHFDEDTVILVGGRLLADASWQGPEQITGRLPSRLRGWGGHVDVVATNGFEQRTLSRAFEYVEELEVSWLSPTAGDVDGTTFVTLYGSGLERDSVVSIGGTVVEVVQPGAGNVMVIRTPPGVHGAADVVVQNSMATITLEQGFTYIDGDELSGSLELLGAWPASVSAGGGDQIALTVAGLAPGSGPSDVTVTVNLEPAAVIEVRPAESLVVIAMPATIEALVEISVTAGGSVVTRDDLVALHPELRIDAITPETAGPAGGSAITLTGAGFTADTVVHIGGQPAVVADGELVEGELSVKMPPVVPGRVDVVVHESGRSAVAAAAFEIQSSAGPELLAVQTEDGAWAGGRLIRLFGRGFAAWADPDILIDDRLMPRVEIIDDATIHVRSPKGGLLGAVTVDADIAGLMPMVHDLFDPTAGFGGTHGGPIPEALNVTVLDATNRQPVDEAFVILWDELDTPYQGLTDERGQITFSDPFFGEPQMVTAAKSQFTTASIVDFDARNATLLLIPLTSSPPAPGGPGPGPQPLPDGTLAGDLVVDEKHMLIPPGKCDPKLESGGTILPGSNICNECTDDDDCSGAGARCVDIGDEGKRCTTECETDDDCPSGFSCTGVGFGRIQCLPSPGEKAFWCGTTIPDVFSRSPSMFGDFADSLDEYTFTTEPGEHAVVCMGGYRDPDTLVFTPLLMGVRRHVFTMPGDVVGAQDVVLDIPLTQTLRLRLDDPPSGPGKANQHRVDIFIDLGSDGVFPMPQRGEGEDLSTLVLPNFPAAFEESLYDATYSIYSQALTPAAVSGLSNEGSFVLMEDITAVLDDAVFEVFDEGAKVTSTGITNDVNAMYGADDGRVWAVGDDGKIIVWDGTWWALQQAPTTVSFRSVWGRSAGDAWAVGDSGAVMRWDGLIWSQYDGIPDALVGANWRGVHGHATAGIFLIGDRGIWLVSETNGWVEISVPPTVGSDAVRAVWSADEAEEAWFVGDGGLVLHWTGGTSTERQDLGGEDLLAIDGAATDDVWAVGRRGRIVHWDGIRWFDYLSLTRRDLHAVHANSEYDVWAVGDAGAILQWDEVRWKVHSEAEHVDLRGVRVTPDERVLAGGIHTLLIGPFLTLPEPVNPTPMGVLLGLDLEWDNGIGPDGSFTFLQLTESTGFPFWMLMVEGRRTTVPLPDLQAAAGLGAIWPGPGLMRMIRVYMPGFDVDRYDNTQLSQYLWRSWSTVDFQVSWP